MQQFLSVQVELGKPLHRRRDIRAIALQPLQEAKLCIANARRQPLVREVEQLPLVRRAGPQLLHAAVCQQQR
ncbi:hypothetical protein D3C85_1592040 [compost metagenome]